MKNKFFGKNNFPSGLEWLVAAALVVIGTAIVIYNIVTGSPLTP